MGGYPTSFPRRSSRVTEVALNEWVVVLPVIPLKQPSYRSCPQRMGGYPTSYSHWNSRFTEVALNEWVVILPAIPTDTAVLQKLSSTNGWLSYQLFPLKQPCYRRCPQRMGGYPTSYSLWNSRVTEVALNEWVVILPVIPTETAVLQKLPSTNGWLSYQLFPLKQPFYRSCPQRMGGYPTSYSHWHSRVTEVVLNEWMVVLPVIPAETAVLQKLPSTNGWLSYQLFPLKQPCYRRCPQRMDGCPTSHSRWNSRVTEVALNEWVVVLPVIPCCFLHTFSLMLPAVFVVFVFFASFFFFFFFLIYLP